MSSVILAEAVRFELTEPCGSPVFKTGALSLSATLPILVGTEGNDPSTPVLSGQCSTSELCASNFGGMPGNRTPS